MVVILTSVFDSCVLNQFGYSKKEEVLQAVSMFSARNSMNPSQIACSIPKAVMISAPDMSK